MQRPIVMKEGLGNEGLVVCQVVWVVSDGRMKEAGR